MAIEFKRENYAVHWLHTQHGDKKLNLDISIQRQAVWNHLHQSNLIVSILNGVPISNLWFEKSGRGKFKVIDGKQRTLTLCSYINDQFPLSPKIRYASATSEDKLGKPVSEKIVGKKFSELSYTLQNRILNYQLSFTIIDEMQAEERGLVFYMGNQSVPLANVHFLPVVLGEQIMDQLGGLCSHPFFLGKTNLTAKMRRGRADLKIILQSVILYSKIDAGFTYQELIEYCDLVTEGTETIPFEGLNEILDYLDSAVPHKRKYLRMTHIPLVVETARKAMGMGVEPAEFGNRLDNFFLNEKEEYKTASMSGIASKQNVRTRLDIMERGVLGQPSDDECIVFQQTLLDLPQHPKTKRPKRKPRDKKNLDYF